VERPFHEGWDFDHARNAVRFQWALSSDSALALAMVPGRRSQKCGQAINLQCPPRDGIVPLGRRTFVPEWLVTLLSVLVGGAIAFGTVLLQQRFARQADAASRHERLTSRYLYQLQDAADSLWFRLDNLSDRSGAPVMDAHDPLYREVTTIYALGRFLAVQRMLTLDGIWPELTRFPSVASLLRDLTLENPWPSDLFHYDRMALGEAVLERDDEGLRTSTYLEFRRRYESDEALPKDWRDRIWKTVERFSHERPDTLLRTLSDLSQALEKATGNESAVARAKQRTASTSGSSSTG
jgi:hypothetical protein